MKHALLGYKFTMERGYHKIAKICLTHSFDCHNIEYTFTKYEDFSSEEYNFLRNYIETVEYDEKRLPIIKEFIGQIGQKYYFQGPIQFNYGCHTFIGDNFFANFNLMVMDDARIYIGNNAMFGPNVSLMATNHPLIAEERTAMNYPDGHIGDNVVIGAGSVVTKDIPSNYLAYGVPYKPVRMITEKDSKLDLLITQ